MLVNPVPSVFMAKIVPPPALPPAEVVPYMRLPEKANPACGANPSLLVCLNPSDIVGGKLCRFVKPLPSGLTVNTAPPPALPPSSPVPYNRLLNKIRPAYGSAPSLFIRGEPASGAKLYKVIKFVPWGSMANSVPAPEPPPQLAVPYKMLLALVNAAYGFMPSLPIKLCRQA